MFLSLVVFILSLEMWQLTMSSYVVCSVERTAGTMMQRMSDMLTRWLEGTVQRAEREAEADEHQDQSDSDERDSSSVAVPADSTSAVEERVEASLQDVANLHLSPGPVNDSAEHVSEVVVNDVLCSASREVEENDCLSDDAARCKAVDTAATLTARISATSDNNVAVSADSDSIVGNHNEHNSTDNHSSESDSHLSSRLQTKHEADTTNSASTSIIADGADSEELLSIQCTLITTDITADEQSCCSQVAAAAVEETNETCHTASIEKNPPSHS